MGDRTASWQRLTLREGEKGLLVADFLHAQVWVWNGEEEQAHCWHLWVGREVGADSISHYFFESAGYALARAGMRAGATVLHRTWFSRSEKRMRHGRLSSLPMGCQASPYGISHAGNAISG